MADSTASRLAMKTLSSSTRLGELQSSSMKLSAKPMSPLRSAAAQTLQLCSRIAPRGSWAAPVPKCACAPSGNCSSSVPLRIWRSRPKAARAAAGAEAGRDKGGAVVLLLMAVCAWVGFNA